MIAIVLPLLAGAVAPPAHVSPITQRVEIRVELVADRREGPAGSCETAEVRSAAAPVSFAFWGTLGPAGSPGRCGAGSYEKSAPQVPSASTTPAPYLIQEVTAEVGWNGGTMDPGPVGAFEILLTLRTRPPTGSMQDGRPQSAAATTDRRSVRLEPGEEFVAPLALGEQGREALGVHDAFARIRIRWIGREGATEYGALAVTGAAPGSEVILDGGVAGHAGADGTLTLANVPTGQREVRMQSPSGSATARMVAVAKGRTIQVAPEPADGGTVPQPALQATEKNAQGFQEYRRKRDGATMVEIPAGEFPMGNLETEGAPQPHTVSVSAFLMDKLPLTVGRYRAFAMATGRPLPPDPYWGVHDDDPVAFVRWDEGKAYCEWAGGRLPTEAEREKAARGTDGRLFPWGSEPPAPERSVNRRNWGQLGNDAVGARLAGASPYGLLDTGGNMWEFCEDWYSADYFASSPKNDPAGPKTGRARIVKGGSWDSRPTVLSASSRNFAYTGYREGDFGFRCAANPPR